VHEPDDREADRHDPRSGQASRFGEVLGRIFDEIDAQASSDGASIRLIDRGKDGVVALVELRREPSAPVRAIGELRAERGDGQDIRTTREIEESFSSIVAHLRGLIRQLEEVAPPVGESSVRVLSRRVSTEA